MIYVTGDTHGEFERFEPANFPEQQEMGREDYVLICGDFGGVWDGSRRDARKLDQLEQLPFTTLFVSGNHENFDRLARYPVEEWQGGLVQRLRPHVLHLMRGQVFTLEGRTFFTMGGARSHDVEDGILDPRADDFEEQYRLLRSMGGRFRVAHRTWWRQELPSEAEYPEARRNLERVGHRVDYIVTHCAPNQVLDGLAPGESYTHDRLTDFLEEVRQATTFRHWFFGHYHEDRLLDGGFVLLWEQIVRLL